MTEPDQAAEPAHEPAATDAQPPRQDTTQASTYSGPCDLRPDESE